jgi:hypothetical protein
MSNWLEQTIRNGTSEILKQKIQSLKESIKKAQLTTFPECLGGEDVKEDSVLQEALCVFMDAAHPTVGSSGSDFIDREARQILSTFPDKQDPLMVPVHARKRAKILIKKALQGLIAYEQVKLPTALDFKREQQALYALVDGEMNDQIQDSEALVRAIDRFLNLVQVDPALLLQWTQQLVDFFREHLQLSDLPPALKDILETYGRLPDVKNITVFGACGVDAPHDKGPSIQHMRAAFQSLLMDVKNTAWPQISLLADLSSLIRIFREKVTDKEALQRKMNVLRMVLLSTKPRML